MSNADDKSKVGLKQSIGSFSGVKNTLKLRKKVPYNFLGKSEFRELIANSGKTLKELMISGPTLFEHNNYRINMFRKIYSSTLNKRELYEVQRKERKKVKRKNK